MDATRKLGRWMLVGAPEAKSRYPVSQTIGVALAAGLLGLAVFVFARRFSGSFENSLGGPAFIASIAAAVVWSAAIRVATAKTDDNRASKWLSRLVEWIPTVALPLTGVALATEGTPMSAVLVAAALITGEEYWAARFASVPAEGSKRHNQFGFVVGRAAEARLGRRALAVESAPEVESAVAMEVEINRDLWQEQRRFLREHDETITGVVRSRFGPRDRVAIEHIAFCPPMASVPRLELEPLDGCECGVRATHVYRYGARIEVKLDQARDEVTECLVAFEARAAIDEAKHARAAPSNR
jgi:hypothetical protein